MTDEEAAEWRAVWICFARPVEALAILRKHMGDDAPAEVVELLERWAAPGRETAH